MSIHTARAAADFLGEADDDHIVEALGLTLRIVEKARRELSIKPVPLDRHLVGHQLSASVRQYELEQLELQAKSEGVSLSTLVRRALGLPPLDKRGRATFLVKEAGESPFEPIEASSPKAAAYNFAVRRLPFVAVTEHVEVIVHPPWADEPVTFRVKLDPLPPVCTGNIHGHVFVVDQAASSEELGTCFKCKHCGFQQWIRVDGENVTISTRGDL